METVPPAAAALDIPTVREGLGGEMRLPGSKSITHRGLVLGALAEGTTRLSGASLSDDCRRTAEALRSLGAEVAGPDGDGDFRVRGWGEGPSGCGVLDAGESGTTARFLLPLLALGRCRFELRGGPRLSQRPMGPLTDALRALGVDIRRLREEAELPLVVRAAGVDGEAVALDAGQSSQFASALLLAAPCFRRGLELNMAGGQPSSRPYLEMTCSMMRRFGVTVERGGGGGALQVPAGSRYSALDLEVEGDASAASYFFAAAALCGGTVRCAPLHREHSLQGDVRFVDLLERMGCAVGHGPGWVEVRGQGLPLRPLDVSMNDMPDMVPTLAVAALFARGGTRISGAGHLRLKESDRLGDLARELRRLGGVVEETGDGMVIEGDGGERLAGAPVQTYNDHRLAMSLAVAGLRLPGTMIENPGCVAKSYPDFFRDLFKLAGHSG